MNERLQHFLELEQLSPSRIADILGIQRSGISHILSGRNKPGFDFIRKMMLKFPTLNAEWLITGKGKVYKEQFSSVTPPDTQEPNLFTKTTDKVNLPYISDSKENTLLNKVSELPENRINDGLLSEMREKKHLVKIIMIYSDHTFEEFSEDVKR